jgi:roadblock/LC7 domain-containing protein
MFKLTTMFALGIMVGKKAHGWGTLPKMSRFVIMFAWGFTMGKTHGNVHGNVGDIPKMPGHT